MPVDFLTLPAEKTVDAKPPSPIVWGLLLVIAIVSGVALTLYLWPKARPAHGWRFYGWLAVAPLTWALCFAARLHSYEIRVWRVQSHNSERTEIVTHNTVYARRPLALIGYAYDTAMGQVKLAERVATAFVLGSISVPLLTIAIGTAVVAVFAGYWVDVAFDKAGLNSAITKFVKSAGSALEKSSILEYQNIYSVSEWMITSPAH